MSQLPESTAIPNANQPTRFRRNSPLGREVEHRAPSGSSHPPAAGCLRDTVKGEIPKDSASLLGIPDGTVEISGGEFNAVAGNHIRLEVNLNGQRERFNDYNSDLETEETWEVRAKRPRATTSNRSPNFLIDAEHPSSKRGWNGDSQTWPSTIPRQVNEGVNTIYFRSLASQRRGSPLWIPEPNKQLPIEYQRNALMICDVGLITDRGCFDSLFNIMLPADHPLAINSDELPRNFSPLQIKPTHIVRYSEFKQGSFLSSESIKTSYLDDNSSGLIFESSASEGAILTLPDGSNSEDLRNKKNLRDYLSAHGEEMYRCALIEHGRIFRNGDLRVVTGFDKTTSWGMAAFSNSNTQHEHSFRLKFRPRDQGSVGRTHSWESSGTAEVKAGPDTREMVALRMGDASQQDVEYANQTVFVRTENVTLSKGIWNALLSESGGGETELGEDPDSSSYPSPPNSMQGSHPSGSSTSSSQATFNSGSQSGPGGSRSHSSSSANTLTVHPSNGINEMLLALNPSARMAITGDQDWISVLTEENSLLPPVDQLWARIRESFVIHLEDDIVFLEKIGTQPTHVSSILATSDLDMTSSTDFEVTRLLDDENSSMSSFTDFEVTRPLDDGSSSISSVTCVMRDADLSHSRNDKFQNHDLKWQTAPQMNMTNTMNDSVHRGLLFPSIDQRAHEISSNGYSTTDDILPESLLPHSPNYPQEYTSAYGIANRSLFPPQHIGDAMGFHGSSTTNMYSSEDKNSQVAHLQRRIRELEQECRRAKIALGGLAGTPQSPAFQASWSDRTVTRKKLFCSLNRAGNALCAWHDSRRERHVYPPRDAPGGYLNCGCSYEEALFEESLARHGVGSYHPGETVRMDPALRNPLLKLLQTRYGYKDGDFEHDPITESWDEGESPAAWEQKLQSGQMIKRRADSDRH